MPKKKKAVKVKKKPVKKVVKKPCLHTDEISTNKSRISLLNERLHLVMKNQREDNINKDRKLQIIYDQSDRDMTFVLCNITLSVVNLILISNHILF